VALDQRVYCLGYCIVCKLGVSGSLKTLDAERHLVPMPAQSETCVYRGKTVKGLFGLACFSLDLGELVLTFGL
jgi:hypothetical protein